MNNSKDWSNMLRAYPIQNSSARIEDIHSPAVVIYVKQTRPNYMVPPISWIVPFRSERRTRLDKLGTEIWRLCDGKHTVEEIIDIFATAHRLTFHEGRVAVSSYISSLIQRGVLAIEMTS